MKKRLQVGIIMLSALLFTACGNVNNKSTSNAQDETVTAKSEEEVSGDSSELKNKLQNPHPDENNKNIIYYEISEEFKSANGLYTNYYKYKMPQLKKEQGNAEKINATIIKLYEKMIERASKEIKDNYTEEESNNTEIQEGNSPYGYTDEAGYTVTYNTDRYLSLLIDGYNYMGGAHGMPYREVLIFNLETGEEVKADQLFAIDKAEFQQKKIAAFEAAIKKEPEMFWEDALEIVKSTKDFYEKGYYLTDQGVVFYYNPYDLAPYAAGFVEVTVPYSDISLK